MANLISFNDAKKFKELGAPQSTDKFYENKSKEVYNTVDIFISNKTRDNFTAAYDGDELDEFLPVDTVVRKSPLGFIAIKGDMSSIARITAVDAKFDLILKLIRKRVVKL